MNRAPVAIRTVNGAEIARYVPEMARLRIEIFRDFPYLYDGDAAYENEYLRTYVDSPESVAVLALAGDELVGVSTGIPLADETEAFARPFVARGDDVRRIFYFGESLLRPAFRGGGTYRAYFREREARARELGGFDLCAFCAVARPADHPARPPGYAPLDAVWRRFGYEPSTDLATTFAWKDVGDDVETEKPMTFWTKRLSP